MSEQQDRLDRTALKYFGHYLLTGTLPGPGILEHDKTEDDMLGDIQAELDELVEDMDRVRSNAILDTVNALGAAYERAGFYSGLKAGACVLLNLTDRRDILY